MKSYVLSHSVESLSDTCADVSDLNDKRNSMFMNVTDAKDLGKSTTQIGRQENKKDSEENYIYRNEEEER